MRKITFLVLCVVLLWELSGCAKENYTEAALQEAKSAQQQAAFERVEQTIRQAEELFRDNCASEAWTLLGAVKDEAGDTQTEKLENLLRDIEASCYKKCFFMRLENITDIKCILIEKNEQLVVYSFDTAQDMQKAGRDYDVYLASHFQVWDGESGVYSDSLGNRIKASWSLSDKSISIEISFY